MLGKIYLIRILINKDEIDPKECVCIYKISLGYSRLSEWWRC